MAARTFFRMWVGYLVCFAAFAPFVGVLWGIGRLFDAYGLPTWVGLIFLLLFCSAFSAWLMTSALVKRALLAMMNWVEQ